MRNVRMLPVVGTFLLLGSVPPAEAALTVFQTYTGNVAVSTDGFGATATSGTISASVPLGATVLAAYLYTATNNNPTHASVGGVLNGNPVAYGAPVVNPDVCCDLASARVNVTAIVAPIINGGPGGVYNFTVTETNTATQDGEALVVVYSLPSLPIATVAVLDGFSRAGGDSFFINFAAPLDPTDPGFFAEMRLGIGFSAGDTQSILQASNVTVNGTLISQNTGGFDDGQLANGALITVGGFDDPFSPLLPTPATDHERYNLVQQVIQGSSTISVRTNNPSNDDNIFLAVFRVAGEADFSDDPPAVVPEPGTISLLALGLAGAGLQARRRRRRVNS